MEHCLKEHKKKNYTIYGDKNIYVLHPAPYQIKVIEFDYSVHSYHFDFYHVVYESESGMYQGHFDSFDLCQSYYQKKFGPLEWIETDEYTSVEYKKIIDNCGNRRTI